MQNSLFHFPQRQVFHRSLVARTCLRAVAGIFVFISGVAAMAGHEVLLVKGHGGQATFGAEIDATASLWQEAAAKAGHAFTLIAPAAAQEGSVPVGSAPVPAAGDTPAAGTQLERVLSALKGVKSEAPEPLWLVLLGHGSAQGRTPKFQLEGPDLTADALAQQLFNLQRPVIVIAGFSASGAFLKPLAGRDRILISATRSGSEENWTRFPRLFASALFGLDADADADGQVSLWEAWRHATRAVEASYKEQGRLCTEHSALEDVGDGRASPQNHGQKAAQWHFLQSPVEAALTPLQRARREEIESRIGRLRGRKNFAAPAEYAAELERLLAELAAVYEGR